MMMGHNRRDGVEAMREDLAQLRQIGAVGSGVTRVAGTPKDVEARAWLSRRYAGIGLDPLADKVGNVMGVDRRHDRAILVGSHSDTVPNGGWLDGALGVIYGLAAAASIDDAPLGIDAVSFADEEGTTAPVMGSRHFFGAPCSDAEYDATIAAFDASNAELGRPFGTLSRLPDLTRYRCFFEAHIEQGPVLETLGKTVGVVTAIAGIRRFRIRLGGRADHAGTAPMDMRRDAGRALLHFLCDAETIFARHRSGNTVWNIGQIAFAPGAANVVPDAAEAVIEFRDVDVGLLDTIEHALRALLDRMPWQDVVGCAGLERAIEQTAFLDPIAMDPRIVETIVEASEALGISYHLMPSGAGHDAMIAARYLPTGMMFVPSIGGRSHHPDEDTRLQDIEAGFMVFRETVRRLTEKMK